ncbi:alpha-L-rhamnosidase-related protein [Carboxylicivirga taeanensis]|uniref:alpha-L-rhamnosidase-related protein n=1 Tax=Carboxylicivirga taeanensis TaxID=1416875 RepID=UPI003F6DAF21
MQKLIIILSVLFILTACKKESQPPIYKGANFSVFKNKVIQGDYSAQVHSPVHITSNYQSPANATFPNVIEFKFAINGKDNEMPMGVNHTFLLTTNEQGRIELPVITFGKKHQAETQSTPSGSIPPNTPLKVQVDASDVVHALASQGYYETFNGQKIYKEDFKGLYIAGNLAPLGWDFDNLAGRTDRQLTDPDNDGIFEITLSLNPYNPDDFTAKEWQLQHNIEQYPQFSSSVPLVDALYNLALDETEMNIEADGTFRTGEEWPGVWTRDVSYSILLAYAFTNPDIAKTSLMRKVKNNRIMQDTGTGGAWPISSDRTTWALAAWEIYKVTGDDEWLKTIYPIIKNTVDDDFATLTDGRSALIKGESSFLDWRKQTYPDWMNGVDIFESRSLGTNAVHAQTYHVLSQMAHLLGKEATTYEQAAQQVKQAVNNELWLENKGYYAQYLYGRNSLMRSPRSEALGEAFTVLFDIANEARALQVINNTPTVDYGIPCIYPQIPEIPPYHNNGIWPFVQAYWNWACAKVGHTEALQQGLAGMNRAAALFLTNKENMVAENGDFRDTEVNSNRQLWSVAGYLSTVYRVFAGMQFELDGLHLSPHVPAGYGNECILTNIQYRKATLSVKILGVGSKIKSCTINGQAAQPFISHQAEGHQHIVIELEETPNSLHSKDIAANRFSLKTPHLTNNRNKLTWSTIPQAEAYLIIRNGNIIDTTSNTEYICEARNQYSEYCVKAINQQNTSFASNIIIWEPKDIISIEAETMGRQGDISAKGYQGKGYIELSKSLNTSINKSVQIPEDGYYLIQGRYSNGSGPDNTDNKCAIRTLFIDGQKAGVMVMPQRGKDEWSNWGYTNLIKVQLKEGKHRMELSFKSYNTNMNGDVNTALLDELRIIPLR